MKKNTIIWIIVAVALAFIGIGSYNRLVTFEETVNSQWANVENQYQRRADLIPNLVATVKGYASHESQTLENVVSARARATQVTIDPTNMTTEKLAEFQAAQGELSSALGRLLMLTENYPDLKANQNFLELQAQLEGTENRITTERMRYNSDAKSYNTTIRRLPTSIVAKIAGFDQKPYFQAEEGSKTAPEVQF